MTPDDSLVHDGEYPTQRRMAQTSVRFSHLRLICYDDAVTWPAAPGIVG